MKTSITIYSYNRPIKAGAMDVKGFIQTAGRLGFQGVDLGYFWKSDNEKKWAVDWAAESGVDIACVITNNDFAQEEPAKRRAELDKVKKAADDARMMGVEIVRVFGGSPKPGMTFDRARNHMLEGLAKAAEYAEEIGITLALENHGTLCGKVAQVKSLIETIGAPTLKANIDIGNFFCVDEDPVRSSRIMAPLAGFVHVKDMQVVNEGGERLKLQRT